MKEIASKNASDDFQNFCRLASKKGADSAVFFGLEGTLLWWNNLVTVSCGVRANSCVYICSKKSNWSTRSCLSIIASTSSSLWTNTMSTFFGKNMTGGPALCLLATWSPYTKPSLPFAMQNRLSDSLSQRHVKKSHIIVTVTHQVAHCHSGTSLSHCHIKSRIIGLEKSSASCCSQANDTRWYWNVAHSNIEKMFSVHPKGSKSPLKYALNKKLVANPASWYSSCPDSFALLLLEHCSANLVWKGLSFCMTPECIVHVTTYFQNLRIVLWNVLWTSPGEHTKNSSFSFVRSLKSSGNMAAVA